MVRTARRTLIGVATTMDTDGVITAECPPVMSRMTIFFSPMIGTCARTTCSGGMWTVIYIETSLEAAVTALFSNVCTHGITTVMVGKSVKRYNLVQTTLTR